MIKFRGYYIPSFIAWMIIVACSISSSTKADEMINELQQLLTKKKRKGGS